MRFDQYSQDELVAILNTRAEAALAPDAIDEVELRDEAQFDHLTGAASEL